MEIIDGLILAAGLSSRMGMFKPLLPLGGETFVAAIARKLRPFCRRIVVVTGHRAEDVRNSLRDCAEADKLEFVHNSNFAAGMFTSLQLGMRAVEDADWRLCHWVDQPNLPEEFYCRFVEECDPLFDVIQPEHANRLGHPLLVGRTLARRIVEADSSASLRDLFQQPVVTRKIWSCDYPQVLQDFDTPSDLTHL
ncbi:nucleotidyltransferase family protein [bacterium]|nr:nucleotidyltransferase family protein [bacterium]